MFFIGQFASSGYNSQTRFTEIINIITGAITSTAGLSSAVWLPGTAKLVNTVPSGWSVADAAAGAVVNAVQPVVIAAPWSDDATKTKNVLMGETLAPNPGVLTMRGYETWNSTTHAGTNPHFAPTASLSSIPQAGNLWLIISASANHLFIAMSNLNGSTTAGLGNAPYYYFLSEYSRDDVWNTVANGYPAWFTCAGFTAPSITSNIMSISRTLNTNSMADMVSVVWGNNTAANVGRIVPYSFLLSADATGAGLETVTSFSTNTASGNAYGASATKQQGMLLSPLRLIPGAMAYTVGTPSFGSIGAKTPFIYNFKALWVAGDEVVINNETYLYFHVGNSSANAFLLREA